MTIPTGLGFRGQTMAPCYAGEWYVEELVYPEHGLWFVRFVAWTEAEAERLAKHLQARGKATRITKGA